MFPLYPGNKPSMMQKWSCVLCFTLWVWGWSLFLIAWGSGQRSHSQETWQPSTFLHEGTGKGSKGIFQGIWSRPSWGVLITLESSPVHHQHRTKPGGNIPASSPSRQLPVAVTKPGDQESVTPCAPMPGYVWYDISSQLEPAVTVESAAQSCSRHQWWDQLPVCVYNVIQRAGSFGSFHLPTTALSEVQVYHMLLDPAEAVVSGKPQEGWWLCSSSLMRRKGRLSVSRYCLTLYYTSESPRCFMPKLHNFREKKLIHLELCRWQV